MQQPAPRIVILTKNTPWGRIAGQLAPEATVVYCGAEPLDHAWVESIVSERFDYLISFYCPWVLPRLVLGRATYAINIHPGDPHYPGFGCYDFALAEGALIYGATMHFMVPEVDAGPIIKVERVEVVAGDTVQTLQARTAIASLRLLEQLLRQIRYGLAPGPDPAHQWTRKAFTRKDLDRLQGVK